MIKSILQWARRPEPTTPPWGTSLPILLVVAYFVAKLVGLLATVTWREENFTDASALSLFLGGIIGSVPVIWLILQIVRNAIRAEAYISRQPPRLITDVLRLTASQSRPLWLIWLSGLAAIIILDIVALVVGEPTDSLPLGLDRMDGVSAATWLTAVALFLLVMPLIEEIIFRGMLYPALASTMQDNVRAVIATTIPFIILYLLQVAGDEVNWRTLYGGVIFPLVLGITAGLARAHSKSTWGAVGCHMAFNLWLLAKALLLFGV